VCAISVLIVLNCEKICFLGNAAVVAEDQKGRKMGQRLKIQCTCAQARLCTNCVCALKCVCLLCKCLRKCVGVWL